MPDPTVPQLARDVQLRPEGPRNLLTKWFRHPRSDLTCAQLEEEWT